MANGDNEDGGMNLYRFKGFTVYPGSATGRLIAEGTVADPVRYADVGGYVELSDEEYENLKNDGAKLDKLDAADAEAVRDKQRESVQSTATRRGIDQTDPQAAVRARRLVKQMDKEAQQSEPSSDEATRSQQANRGEEAETQSQKAARPGSQELKKEVKS